jgi:hypothetical protein
MSKEIRKPEVPVNSPDIITYSRQQLEASQRIENPESAEDALFNFVQSLSSIKNIVGFRITGYEETGLLGTTYMNDASAMTEQEETQEADALGELRDNLLRLRLPNITFGWVTSLGDKSFEKVIEEQRNENRLSKEDKEKLENGDIPEGWNVVNELNYLGGLYEEEIGEPMYIKFED